MLILAYYDTILRTTEQNPVHFFPTVSRATVQNVQWKQQTQVQLQRIVSPTYLMVTELRTKAQHAKLCFSCMKEK